MKSSSILNEVENLTKIIDEGMKPVNALIGGATLLGLAIASFLAVKSGLVEKLMGEADKITSGSPVNTYGVHVGYGKKLTFDEALKIVLQNEGGLANQKHDKGGLTNKGITQGTYDAWRVAHGLKKQSVKNITEAEIRKIYHDNYWVASGADKENNPAMQIALFDSAVLYGVGRAKQWKKKSGGDFDKFIQARKDYTNKIIASDSTQQKFKKGWDNRTNRIANIGKQLQYEQATPEENRPTIANKTKTLAKGTSNNILSTAKRMYGKSVNSTGYCARAVHNILVSMGFKLNKRASAHDYIDELSKNSYFSKVSPSSVRAGDIVIYAKSQQHIYGHIFISDGTLLSGVSDFSGNQFKPGAEKEYGAIHVFRVNEGNVRDKANQNEVIANKPVPKVNPKLKNQKTVASASPKSVTVTKPKPNVIATGKEPMVARNT